jgi:hypothetical protein
VAVVVVVVVVGVILLGQGHGHVDDHDYDHDHPSLIDGISQDTDGLGRVARRERLGGLLSFYYREAA